MYDKGSNVIKSKLLILTWYYYSKNKGKDEEKQRQQQTYVLKNKCEWNFIIIRQYFRYNDTTTFA